MTDRVLGFVASTGDRDLMTVETSRGAEQTISTAKYEVTGRGGKGRELLQRGQFTKVVWPCPTRRSRCPNETEVEMIGQTLFALVLLAGAIVPPPETEWARFRGPNGSGVADVTGLPVEFGPTHNVIWKLDLPPGYSSPIVSGNRIYLTGIRDGRLMSFAIDRTKGTIALGARGAARSAGEARSAQPSGVTVSGNRR